MSKLPDFVIIGAQKSASTFIQNCLQEHPGIFMPPGEIPFFEDPDYGRGDISRLEKLFVNVDPEKVRGIKRPNYLSKPEVPERLHKHLSHAKLIVVLRNPVDRALSSYFHNIKYGFIPAVNPKRGFKKLIAGEWKKKYPRGEEIIDFGFYFRHLQRYLKYFDRDQILILIHHEVAEDNLGAVKKTYKFLGVDENFVPKRALTTRPQSVVYSLLRLRVLRLRNRFIFKYNSNRTRLEEKRDLSLIARLVNKFILLLDRKILTRLVGTKKPKFPIELKKMLYSVYKNDIVLLEGLLGQKLTEWKPP